MPMYMSAKQRKEQEEQRKEQERREAEAQAERELEAKRQIIAESKYFYEIKQTPGRMPDDDGRAQYWWFVLERGKKVQRFGEFDSYPGHVYGGHKHKDLMTATYAQVEEAAINKILRALETEREEEEQNDRRPDLHSRGHS